MKGLAQSSSAGYLAQRRRDAEGRNGVRRGPWSRSAWNAAGVSGGQQSGGGGLEGGLHHEGHEEGGEPGASPRLGGPVREAPAIARKRLKGCGAALTPLRLRASARALPSRRRGMPVISYATSHPPRASPFIYFEDQQKSSSTRKERCRGEHEAIPAVALKAMSPQSHRGHRGLQGKGDGLRVAPLPWWCWPRRRPCPRAIRIEFPQNGQGKTVLR